MGSEWIRRTVTARVEVPVTVTRPPGRGQEWTATVGTDPVGPVFTTGKTEKATRDALTGQLAAFITRYGAPRIVTYGGHVAVVSIEPGEERDGRFRVLVQFVTPDGGTGGHVDTSAESWGEALAYARHWLAQRVTDWHDDASVHAGAVFLAGADRYGHGQWGPAEFYRYAAWQRAAKHAIDAGMGDGFHEWAGDHWREFIVPGQGQ